MALINRSLVADAHLLARQTLATALGAVATTTSITTTPTSTGPLSSPTSSITPFSISSTPSASETVANGQTTSTSTSDSSKHNGGGSSSPLLFFVALGFGVVFTNLWIIVGVKYCFRYNARNRQLRLNEEGEPITLETMPRPHRRRREKKLMTMDEVNEKFPMQKYKTWVATRAQEGLPTCGGVSAPQDVAESIHHADGGVSELPSKERVSTEERPATSATNALPEAQTLQDQTGENTSSAVNPAQAPTEAEVSPTASADRPQVEVGSPHDVVHMDDDDDDDHIDAALPPECMGTAGDTCAICIDTLEDDDDVRGLTCGHTFHAVCVDPWLTSRRACCPLCKADYYTPKPRPVAEAGDGALSATTRDPRRGNMPTRPQATWLRGRTRLANRFGGGTNQVRDASTQQSPPQQQSEAGGRWFRFFDSSRQRTDATATAGRATSTEPSSRSGLASLGSVFPGVRTSERTDEPAGSGPIAPGAVDSDVTPSNLEAGMHSVANR